jgi:hypothetical protein
MSHKICLEICRDDDVSESRSRDPQKCGFRLHKLTLRTSDVFLNHVRYSNWAVFNAKYLDKHISQGSAERLL